MDAIGEQQLSIRKRRAAAEADTNGEQHAVEADQCNRGAAGEVDAIGEHQLCTESCPALDYSRRRTRGK